MKGWKQKEGGGRHQPERGGGPLQLEAHWWIAEIDAGRQSSALAAPCAAVLQA